LLLNVKLTITHAISGETLKPNINPLGIGGIVVGSTQLENSVMETFQQANAQNCFQCHTTRQQWATPGSGPSIPPTNLNISHALMKQLLTQGAAATPPR
jgi:mono/diheme cytochrome c family protein